MTEDIRLSMLKTNMRNKMIDIIYKKKVENRIKEYEEDIEQYKESVIKYTKWIKETKENIKESKLKMIEVEKEIKKLDKRNNVLYPYLALSIDFNALEKEADDLAKEFWNKPLSTENPEIENPETKV